MAPSWLALLARLSLSNSMSLHDPPTPTLQYAEVDIFKISTKKDDVKTRQLKRHAAATQIEALMRGELVRLKGLV